MNAYRVLFTTESNDAAFSSRENREVELIRVNVGSPMVLSVEYDHRNS